MLEIVNINVQDQKQLKSVTVTDQKVTQGVFVDENGVVFGSLPPQPDLKAGITFNFDNGNNALQNGKKCDVSAPFSGVIESVQLVAPNQSGSVSIDIAADAFATYPASFVSIVDTTPPALNLEQKYFDDQLVNWSTTVTKGQILRATLSGVVSVTKLNLVLNVKKTVS